MNILAAWPLIKWALQALGFKGPEDVEAERNFKMRLLEAQAAKDEGLIKAWAAFHAGRSRIFELFQIVVLVGLYYDVFWGQRRAVIAAAELTAAGIGGLLVMALLLFPFYGAALVPAVAAAFHAAVDATVSRRAGSRSGDRAGVGGENAEPLATAPTDSPDLRAEGHRPFSRESGFRGRPDPNDEMGLDR